MWFSKNGMPIVDMKMPAAAQQIAAPSFRATLSVPLSMRETPQCANIKAKQTVLKGAPLFTDEKGLVTAAPVSGTLITYFDVPHPLYGNLVCAAVAPAEGEVHCLGLQLDAQKATAEQIIKAAKIAGIIDETDGVPLYEKLENNRDAGVTLVADATEPQPFASAAFCVLRDLPDSVRGGLALAATAVHTDKYHITVCLENDDMETTLKKIYKAEELYFAPPIYPVAQFAKDKDVRVCTVGVQALVALYEAVYNDMPFTDTVITVAGDGVRTPQNVRVPFGLPIQSLLDYCGVVGNTAAIILGDAITGVAVADTTIPVLAGMTCLLLLQNVAPFESDPCMGCGKCAAACHKQLLPYEIVRRLENMHYERLVRLRADLCDGCGACSFVCPAHRDVMNAVLYAAQTGGSVVLNWGGDNDA